MKTTSKHDDRIASMIFGSVYPHYLNKVEKKGRTQHELDEVISWLTGFSKQEIHRLIEAKVNFEAFFKEANLNANSNHIKGMICGYRVEEIQNPLTQKVRFLDKLIDELAKGKKIEKIFRTQ